MFNPVFLVLDDSRSRVAIIEIAAKAIINGSTSSRRFFCISRLCSCIEITPCWGRGSGKKDTPHVGK